MASVELDFEEFRTWFPGLTEDVIPDALLEVFWEQVCEFVGNTDEKSFAPYDPDATPPKNERKALLYYALCHFATLSVLRLHSGGIRRPAAQRTGRSRPSIEWAVASTASRTTTLGGDHGHQGRQDKF